jgi:hypothetical protein
MGVRAGGKPDQAGQAAEEPMVDQDSSGQQHHNPETEEDTASGGAPEQ